MPRFSGQKLAEVRERQRKTQTDLASGLRRRGFGTTQTQVSRWESGQAPRAYIIEALAEELGVTPDALFAEDLDAEAAAMTPLAAERKELLDALQEVLLEAIDGALTRNERRKAIRAAQRVLDTKRQARA